MRLADFDYDLPDHLIARHPPERRRDSRLLVLERDANAAAESGMADRRFADLPSLLQAGDLLVMNDTQVVKARLRGQKDTGGRVELLIERPVADTRALAHVKASKSPRAGVRLHLGPGLEAQVLGRAGNLTELEFNCPVDEAMERHGEVPLPPYLERAAEEGDETRYQTVYAREPGAVAAPTAGLHFDEALLAELDSRQIQQRFVTLHVGAGTFQTLKHDVVDDNRLHYERVVVGPDVVDAVAATRRNGGRVVAVGTTVVRALESAAAGGELKPFAGETDLFIRPGYQFACVDALCTNFHLPQSSLLMLVSALVGRERTLAAYRHAVAREYRFFSYGDAMLILPAAAP